MGIGIVRLELGYRTIKHCNITVVAVDGNERKYECLFTPEARFSFQSTLSHHLDYACFLCKSFDFHCRQDSSQELERKYNRGRASEKKTDGNNATS